jgi:hypothetical protein
MKSKDLVIKTTTSISVPTNTNIITNGEFLTLSRKKGNTYSLFTCPIEEVNSHDYSDENIWMDFTKDELKQIIS